MTTDNTNDQTNPVHNFPDGWDNEWQPDFPNEGKPTIDDLRAAMDAAALEYYQFGVMAAILQKAAADAVYNAPADIAELNRKGREAYFIQIDLDEKRDAFYKAFGAYYQFIILRDGLYNPPKFKNITSFNNDNGVIEWRK